MYDQYNYATSILGVGHELLSTHLQPPLMQAFTTHNIAVLYSRVDCLAWRKTDGLWCLLLFASLRKIFGLGIF